MEKVKDPICVNSHWPTCWWWIGVEPNGILQNPFDWGGHCFAVFRVQVWPLFVGRTLCSTFRGAAILNCIFTIPSVGIINTWNSTIGVCTVRCVGSGSGSFIGCCGRVCRCYRFLVLNTGDGLRRGVCSVFTGSISRGWLEEVCSRGLFGRAL